MVKGDLMGILVREAAKGTRQMMLVKAGDGSLGGGCAAFEQRGEYYYLA